MSPPNEAGLAAINVAVNDTQDHLAIDPAWIVRLVQSTLAIEGVTAATISVAVVDDASIRVINRLHLGHDWETDVVSFGLSGEDDRELVGDLIVSAQMAVARASDLNIPVYRELALYLVHGLLHLCGHDDYAEADVVAMRAREAAILGALAMMSVELDQPPVPTRFALLGRETVRWPR